MKGLKGAHALALALAPVGGSAQTYRDSSGTIVQGVFPLPYGYTPLPPGQHNLALTSSTALTIPTGARYATICASTASVGMPLPAGACVALSGATVLANFLAISATGTLDVEFFQ